MRLSLVASSIVFATLSLSTVSAFALTVEVTHAGPSVVGEAHAFTATVTDAEGAVTFEWTFGDSADFQMGDAEVTHTFTGPGHFTIGVQATDATGNTSFDSLQHLVHFPLTALRPTSSTSIVFDAARNRVYSVNQDNDTVTSIDADGLAKVAELEVYRKPESLALTAGGKLWVVHQDDYAVAVVDPDRFVIERGFRLPYASQPVGVAMSPTGDAAYVSLMAVGKLLKLDPAGEVLGECEVGPHPRGIAVSHDGRDVYVTRFISPDSGGEVVKVDASTMTVAARVVLRVDTETMDSDLNARGLPNYLFSVALTPDGFQAWIPGKKDNIVRGKLRDGLDLTHDTTVRPLAAVIDTAMAREIYENRVDLDNRSMPVHVEFTPFGDFAILTLAGSNRVEVRDVFRPTQVFSAISDVGTFPRASVLTPSGRLFVQAALSRNVLVYDMSALVDHFDQSTPIAVGEPIPAVANEKLSRQILDGKKIFHDAEDVRMAFEGYLSCGGCHFEGIDDGRIWDFSTRGEGFRNTVALLGREGTGQGPLNWTATLDEVQDFEHQIRELFDGRGFLPDDVFHVGTRDQPLGDPKAGLSPELDALAAYVASLDHVNPSPYRNSDGSLTPDGAAGKALFERLGCDFCHAGPDFTDSARGSLHDVGTITALSGTHAGGPLIGFDTPTLLGVWETPPYLHDGSAPTLRDVLTTKNPDDLHGFVSSLSSEQVDQLASYLEQIDNELPVRRLPFDPPPLGGSGGVAGGGTGGMPGGASARGGSASGAGAEGGAAAASGRAPVAPPEGDSSDCGCRVPGGAPRNGGGLVSVIAGLGLVVAAALRGRRRERIGTGLILTILVLAVSGCGSSDQRNDPTPAPTGGGGGATDGWENLPAVTHPDPELEELGSRGATIQRVCARGRDDPFSRALCDGPRPDLGGMTDLLELVGLANERAFALTGNSTSLVTKSVSAVNPRMLVFPRVEGDRTPPESLTAVGFVRGEPFVELVSRDPVTEDLDFYLLAFEQRCSYESAGCDLAHLLGEEIEHDWTAYSVYDHEDLEPTSFDCLSCHRPGGQGTKRILRMQELASPWMHWFPQRFVQRTDSDRVLLAEFAEAHEVDTQYGGIPVSVITSAVDEGSSAQLEALVRAEGFGEQPNPFDALIATEMKSGSSPTWQARFDAHLRGEAIAVPYPRIDVTDEAKRSAAVGSYRDVVRGAAPRGSLLDLRLVFSSEAEEKLSFVPQPGADGKTVLMQMCARCHDGRGNPNLDKNLFDVRRLEAMPRSIKDLAIERMNASDETHMPPWRAGTLTPEAIQAATLELQK